MFGLLPWSSGQRTSPRRNTRCRASRRSRRPWCRCRPDSWSTILSTCSSSLTLVASGELSPLGSAMPFFSSTASAFVISGDAAVLPSAAGLADRMVCIACCSSWIAPLRSRMSAIFALTSFSMPCARSMPKARSALSMSPAPTSCCMASKLTLLGPPTPDGPPAMIKSPPVGADPRPPHLHPRRHSLPTSLSPW